MFGSGLRCLVVFLLPLYNHSFSVPLPLTLYLQVWWQYPAFTGESLAPVVWGQKDYFSPALFSGTAVVEESPVLFLSHRSPGLHTFLWEASIYLEDERCSFLLLLLHIILLLLDLGRTPSSGDAWRRTPDRPRAGFRPIFDSRVFSSVDKSSPEKFTTIVLSSRGFTSISLFRLRLRLLSLYRCFCFIRWREGRMLRESSFLWCFSSKPCFFLIVYCPYMFEDLFWPWLP